MSQRRKNLAAYLPPRTQAVCGDWRWADFRERGSTQEDMTTWQTRGLFRHMRGPDEQDSRSWGLSLVAGWKGDGSNDSAPSLVWPHMDNAQCTKGSLN